MRDFGQKPPELQNVVTMAEPKESFDDVPEKISEEILQEGEIVLYEEEEEDRDPLGRLSNCEIAKIYSRLPSEERRLYRELIQNY